MRRFLSWIVTFIFLLIFDVVNSLLGAGINYAFLELNKLSNAAYIIVLLLCGGTILGIISFVLRFAAICIAGISQAVWKSKKGTRYIVFAIIFALLYALMILGSIKGFIEPKLRVIVYGMTGIVFSVMFAIYGKARSEDDGAPPAKVERLEAKLEKLKSKENN